MGLITGLGASINGMRCLEQFRVVTNAADNAVTCSDAGGAVVRSEANLDFSGIAVGVGHTPPILPGQTFQFAGGDRAGQGWVSHGTGSRADNTSAIVERVQIFCTPQQNKLFYYHLYFAGNGSLDKGTYTPNGYTSLLSAPPSSIGMAFQIGGAAVSGVESWNFDIRSKNTRPIWTSDGDGWAQRSPGNIDAMLIWMQNFDAVTDLAEIEDAANLFKEYKLFVTKAPATPIYWDVKWMKLLEEPAEYVINGPDNRPEYVSATLRAGFSAFDNSATPVKGFITTPAGATLWPT